MRDLRRQNKTEPKKKEEMPNLHYNDLADKIEESARDVTMVSSNPLGASELDLIKQLQQLKVENDLLKIASSKLSRNENKLLSAIKSEIINQSTPCPIISRTKFLTKLGMNSKYLDDSIRGLVERKIIERTPVKYSANIMTNSWKIL